MVRGTDGTPIAGATVSVPLLDRALVTAADGTYLLRALPATTVAVQFRAIGYQPLVRRVALRPGATDTLDVALRAATVELTPLVVTGTAAGGDQLAAQDVAALSSEQLRAGATASLGATLAALPGVSNISGGPVAGNPVLRGLSQHHVRVTRDGVPQESFQATPRWFPPGNLAAVGRVEVVRGPASILYGSSAIGGAINLLPPALPTGPAGRLTLDGLVETQYFTNNRERYAHGEVSGSAGSRVGFRAGGSRRVAGEFRTARAAPYEVTGREGDPLVTGTVPHTGFEQSGGYAQLGYTADWGQVQAFYDGWTGSNDFPNAGGRPTGVAMTNHDLRLKATAVAGAFVVKPSLVYQFARIQRAATAALTYEQAEATDGWDQDLHNNVVTGRVEVLHPAVAGIRGTIGVEYASQGAVTRRSAIQPSATTRNVAAFLFEELRGERFSLSAGGRFDHRRQQAGSNSLVHALPESEREAALARTFTVFTGSLGAGYRVLEPLTVSVNVSTGFRAPSLIDLYTDEHRPVLGGWQEGNPLLEPERSTSVEGSVRLEASRLAARATVYRNVIANYVYITRSDRTRDVNGTPRPVFETSQTDARIFGIELSANGQLTDGITLEGSYSRIRSRNRSTGEALALMPADQLRGAVRLSRWRVGPFREPFLDVGVKHAFFKAIAGPTEPFAEFDDNPQGFGVSSTPAYTLVDVGVGSRITVGGGSIDVTVTLENALDEAYRDFLDTQKGFTLGQGRNLGIRLSAPLAFTR